MSAATAARGGASSAPDDALGEFVGVPDHWAGSAALGRTYKHDRARATYAFGTSVAAYKRVHRR